MSGQQYDPEFVACVLAMSDERDAWQQVALQREREGFQRGAEAASERYEAGFADGCLSLKHAQHDLVQAAEAEAGRWSVRGEPRTRETFADAHPGDYEGTEASRERGDFEAAS
jgi:hypothetical protein